MNDFWRNIARYPRFFISSLVGLIFVILTPFKNLFKISKFRIVVVSSLCLFILVLYLIIKNMSGI